MSYLDELTEQERKIAGPILNPIGERADQVGLRTAMTEHWERMMTPAATASMTVIFPNLRNSKIEQALAALEGADRGAIRGLYPIIAHLQGWDGEQI